MNVPIYWFRPKKWFDVRIKELVSKVQNSGPFLRKKRSSFWVDIFVLILMKFWLQGYNWIQGQIDNSTSCEGQWDLQKPIACMESNHSTAISSTGETTWNNLASRKRHDSTLNLFTRFPLCLSCLLPSLSWVGRECSRTEENWSDKDSRPTAQICLHIEGLGLLCRWRPAAWHQRWVHRCNLGSWSSPGVFHHLLGVYDWGLDHWILVN